MNLKFWLYYFFKSSHYLNLKYKSEKNVFKSPILFQNIWFQAPLEMKNPKLNIRNYKLFISIQLKLKLCWYKLIIILNLLLLLSKLLPTTSMLTRRKGWRNKPRERRLLRAQRFATTQPVLTSVTVIVTAISKISISKNFNILINNHNHLVPLIKSCLLRLPLNS